MDLLDEALVKALKLSPLGKDEGQQDSWAKTYGQTGTTIRGFIDRQLARKRIRFDAKKKRYVAVDKKPKVSGDAAG